MCPRYMCILLYVKLFGVVVFNRSMVDSRGVHLPWVYVHSSICDTYSVQWCSMDIWSIGGGGMSSLGIFAFFYMSNLFDIVVFHRSMVNWRKGVHVPYVYLHSSICKIYSVQLCFIDLWSNGAQYICPRYMCILLYVKPIWCSGGPQIYGQLEKGGYVCPRYMCIPLYVKLILCSDVPQIYGQQKDMGTSALGICAFFYI